MQAINSSIKRCKDRNASRVGDDEKLIQYAEWLIDKQHAAIEYEKTVKEQIKQADKFTQ